MKRKPYVGIRTKALLAVVLLVLAPSLFLAAFTYHVRDEAVRTVKENTISELKSMSSDYMIKLNRNATECINKYMKSMEIEGKSAAKILTDYIHIQTDFHDAVWGSRYLLQQVNITMITEIMNSSLENSYYTEIVNIAGEEAVDYMLSYFINPPVLDYSSAHVNESAYIAINSVRHSLGNHSHLIYDFLYSVMYPEYRRELDEIMPIGRILYSFREVPDMLWSYFASAESGFIVLIPSDADFSPLFNPWVRDWYIKAVEKDGTAWSDAYIDEISGMPMVTFSVPVYKNGSLKGVLGFDLLLSTLSNKTREFYTGGMSFAFTISPDGTALTHPDERVIGNSLVEGNTDFNDTVREILNNSNGGLRTQMDGEDVFMAYSTINATGWKFVNVIYCTDLMENARKSANVIGDIVEKEVIYIMCVIVAVGLVAFVATFFLIDGFVRDIEHLTEIADKVSKGDLNVRIEVDAKDEMGELEKALKRMVNSIKIAMEELEEGERRER